MQLQATIARLQAYGLPIILVDDGSDQETAARLDALAAADQRIRLLRLPFNQGKGVAVWAGLEAAAQAGCSHALQIDADGQHDPTDIARLLDMASANPTALISGRPQFGADMPAARRYGRYVTHFWVWVETLSLELADSMCGFRVYPVAATLRQMRRCTPRRRMDFDTDIMVRLYWAGIPVKFVDTQVIYPPNGVSHFAPLRDNLQISWMHTCLVLGMLWRSPWLLLRLLRRNLTANV